MAHKLLKQRPQAKSTESVEASAKQPCRPYAPCSRTECGVPVHRCRRTICFAELLGRATQEKSGVMPKRFLQLLASDENADHQSSPGRHLPWWHRGFSLPI